MKRLDVRPRTVRKVLVLAAIASGIVVFAGPAAPPSFVGASEGQFAALRDALLPGGITIESLPPDQATAMLSGPVTAQVAADVAVREFGKVDPPVVFLALVTVSDLQPAIKGAPMYIVQLTGMNLPPLGKYPGAATDEDIHKELIVFVDPVTGEDVISVTAR